MVGTLRDGLFVAYSRRNCDWRWRDRFVKHLKSVVTESELFVDRASIQGGADWELSIENAVNRAKCALLLLTDSYLDKSAFAREHELPLLLEAHEAGHLVLLPVLVEPCSWQTISQLSKLELMPWPGDTRADAVGEDKRALSEARSPDRAVVAICNQLRKQYFSDAQQAAGGSPAADRPIDRDFTDAERADVPQQLRSIFADRLTLDSEKPLHRSEFSLVYSGRLGDDHVAIKVVPTTALRKRVQRILKVAEVAHENLQDTSFVHVREVVRHPEAEAVLMDFEKSPTLSMRLEKRCGRLAPAEVAALLAKVSLAQSEAHKRGVPLGALSPLSIFVDDDGDVRLSPFRIEAHLARGLTLGDDQVVSGDVLEMLTPETYEGRTPTTRGELDAHGQYYLGLLGLELLLGRRPVTIRCLKDLKEKQSFFADPRSHFEPADSPRWTDAAPGLAFLLARMLAESPNQRLESAEVVSNELRRVADGDVPDVVRRSIEADYATTMEQRNRFARRFYARLFATRPTMRSKFTQPDGMQAKHLTGAIQDLLEFRKGDRAPRLIGRMQSHAERGITPDDADAFRRAFVAEVIASCDPPSSNITPQMHGDAWNAALKLWIDTMLGRSLGLE
jgi:hypothetical protein